MTLITTLTLIAFLLFFLEIFLPGGILAIIGTLLLVGAAYLVGVEYGLAIGGSFLLLSAVFGVFMFFLEVKLMQHTAVGRYFKLDSSIMGTSNKAVADDSIVHKRGVSLTVMNPGGKISVEGRTYDAASTSGLLEPGTEIEVVRIEAFKVVVKNV
ncbi:MAG: NfeD family protein [Opitutaceae bacterium]|nr:NfeD family protein [Opitutaceae bacterium]